MNSSFEAALNIRLLWMKKLVLEKIELWELAIEVRDTALMEVAALAYDERSASVFYGEKVPPLFHDVPELSDEYTQSYTYWSNEFSLMEWEEQERQAEREAKQARTEKIERAVECIERGAWAELDLHTPEELYEVLISGQPIKIDGHSLHFDESDGVTWMDNPYGVEGVLGEIPTVDMARRFLTRIAKGGMYGPEP